MSNNSIIEHRGSYFYIEFREEYLAICLKCSYKKPVTGKVKCKSSPYCKALILAILESWTNEKRGKGESLAIFMTYPQWIDAMYGMFGRTVIIDSLDELLGEGLISREKYKMYGKDTYKYLLNYKDLNRRVKDLPERDPKQTHPQVNASTSGRHNSKDASTSKRESRPLVDDDASTSGHNIESTNLPDIESKENIADDSATQTFAPDVARPPLSSLGYSSEELIAEATRIEHLSLTEEYPIVTATPETTQSMSARNTSVDNKPEQQSLMPDKKPKAPSKSKERHTEELNPGMLPADLKPKGPPSVPSADAPWPSKETAVQIVEAKKGRAYSKTTRAQELAEAGKVLEMAVDNAPITREQFESAWDDLASSSWWEEHGKPCMIKYLRRDDTIVGIIKKLARKGQTRTKTTSTQVQNTTTARVDEEAAKRNFDRMMASVAAKGVN